MKNNKGMSLVEVLIVVIILGVLSTVGVIGISMVSGKPAEQCASNIKSTITNNRMTAMSKASSSLTFTKEADGIYVTEVTEGLTTKTKIGDKDVSVVVDKGGVETSLDDASFSVSFNRATGAFDEGADISKIIVSKANKTRTLTFYNLTGKVTME